MKKMMWACLAFGALVTSACGVESEEQRTTTQQAAEVGVQAAIWHDEGTESCADINDGLPCNGSRPTPQCNGAVAGAACTPPGGAGFYSCWKVISSTLVKNFTCY